MTQSGAEMLLRGHGLGQDMAQDAVGGGTVARWTRLMRQSET